MPLQQQLMHTGTQYAHKHVKKSTEHCVDLREKAIHQKRMRSQKARQLELNFQSKQSKYWPTFTVRRLRVEKIGLQVTLSTLSLPARRASEAPAQLSAGIEEAKQAVAILSARKFRPSPQGSLPFWGRLGRLAKPTKQQHGERYCTCREPSSVGAQWWPERVCGLHGR